MEENSRRGVTRWRSSYHQLLEGKTLSVDVSKDHITARVFRAVNWYIKLVLLFFHLLYSSFLVSNQSYRYVEHSLGSTPRWCNSNIDLHHIALHHKTVVPMEPEPSRPGLAPPHDDVYSWGQIDLIVAVAAVVGWLCAVSDAHAHFACS